MRIRVLYSLGSENYGRLADLDAIAEIAKKAYGNKRIVGGRFNQHLQCQLVDHKLGRRNESGKSVTTSVDQLIEYVTDYGAFAANSAREAVLREIVTPPPWIKKRYIN